MHFRLTNSFGEPYNLVAYIRRTMILSKSVYKNLIIQDVCLTTKIYIPATKTIETKEFHGCHEFEERTKSIFIFCVNNWTKLDEETDFYTFMVGNRKELEYAEDSAFPVVVEVNVPNVGKFEIWKIGEDGKFHFDENTFDMLSKKLKNLFKIININKDEEDES